MSDNSLNDDIRRFLPDEVFETEEDADETMEAIIGYRLGSRDGKMRL